MRSKLMFLMVIALLLISNISAQDDTATFTVTIENVSGTGKFSNTGVMDSPVDAETPGPILPGQAYEIGFPAFMAERFAFVMGVAELDNVFIATLPEGVELYDADGNAPEGDITQLTQLWYLSPDEPHLIRPASELAAEGVNYPAVNDLVQVIITPTLEPTSMDGSFSVRLENISDQTGNPTPLTPGVWVLHGLPGPFFAPGEPDYREGLQELVEQNDNGPLATVFLGSELTTAISPVLWLIDDAPDNPFFTPGRSDYLPGLEALAEDGDPSALMDSVSRMSVSQRGIEDTPVDSGEVGPAAPGDAYIFEITASSRDYLSFATKFSESNDLFFAPEEGIALFEDGVPVDGTVTQQVTLWDAGTEVNEEPGVGENQAPRQSAPNTGEDEGGVVTAITQVDDGFSYPPAAAIIQVTIKPRG